MDPTGVVNLTGQAQNILRDELSRGGRSSVPDPAGSTLNLNVSNLDCLRKRHAFLNEYSDELLSSTPLETLLKLETTSIKLKNLENSKANEDKLSFNRDKLSETEFRVASGTDNRWSSLHEARYLPGMCCTTVKMWNRAREVIGSQGHPAVGIYDMAGVGLAGHVTPQGWIALHDPGCSNISLRMFSISNCGRKVTTKTGDGSDDGLADVVELGEFKCALTVLREAMAFVHPWNKSISALEGFLRQSNFCSHDLEGVEKQASILTQFVDYTLRENSNRWKGQESFLTLGDLKSTWESFFGSRPQSVLAKSKKSAHTSNNSSSHNNTHSSNRGNRPYVPNKLGVHPALFLDDICVMWNLGKCVKPQGTCKTKAGRVLRHCCNFRGDPSNMSRYCGLDHAAVYWH